MRELRISITSSEADQLTVELVWLGPSSLAPWPVPWRVSHDSGSELHLEVDADLLGSGRLPLGEVAFLLQGDVEQVGRGTPQEVGPIDLLLRIEEVGLESWADLVFQGVPGAVPLEVTLVASDDLVLPLSVNANVMGPAEMALRELRSRIEDSCASG